MDLFSLRNNRLRLSVGGLAIIIKQDFKMDVFGNYLFLFCNRKRNRLKGLSWDSNGNVLYYKRLDGEGARFKWPKDPKQTDLKTLKPLKRLDLDITGLSPEIIAYITKLESQVKEHSTQLEVQTKTAENQRSA